GSRLDVLDRAAERLGLRRVRIVPGEQRLDRVGGPAMLHRVGIVVAVVGRAVVAQAAVAVEDEQLRGARGAVSARRRLAWILAEREREALGLGAGAHRRQ